MAHSLVGIAQDHDFDTTFTAEYDKDTSATTIVTPTSGKLIKVTGVKLSTEGATSAGAKVRIYFATSGNTIASFYVTNAVQNTVLDPIVVRGQRNEPIKVTSNLGDDKNFYLSINYKEE